MLGDGVDWGSWVGVVVGVWDVCCYCLGGGLTLLGWLMQLVGSVFGVGFD